MRISLHSSASIAAVLLVYGLSNSVMAQDKLLCHSDYDGDSAGATCGSDAKLSSPAPIDRDESLAPYLSGKSLTAQCEAACYRTKGCKSLGFDLLNNDCRLYSKKTADMQPHGHQTGFILYHYDQGCFTNFTTRSGVRNVDFETGSLAPFKQGKHPAQGVATIYSPGAQSLYAGRLATLSDGSGGAFVSLLQDFTICQAQYNFNVKYKQLARGGTGGYGNVLFAISDSSGSMIVNHTVSFGPGKKDSEGTIAGYWKTISIGKTFKTKSTETYTMGFYLQGDSNDFQRQVLIDDIALDLQQK